MHFLTFIRQRHSILHQTEASSATYHNYINKSQAMSLMTSVLRWYIAEYTDANCWHYPIRCRITFASTLEWIFNAIKVDIISTENISLSRMASWCYAPVTKSYVKRVVIRFLWHEVSRWKTDDKEICVADANWADPDQWPRLIWIYTFWARSYKNVSYAICEQQRCWSACASAHISKVSRL